jgi:hypothetical protein
VRSNSFSFDASGKSAILQVLPRSPMSGREMVNGVVVVGRRHALPQASACARRGQEENELTEKVFISPNAACEIEPTTDQPS